MHVVFLDGDFLEPGSAKLSCFDAGLQHGVGLFETMIGGWSDRGPWAHHLDRHLERLTGSAHETGLSESLKAEGLRAAVLETVRRSALARARVRATITGGDLNLLSRERGGGPARPTIMIAATAATEYPPEMFERGVTAAIASMRTNPLDPLAGHKTLNYWARLRELQQAASLGAGESLVFQVSNHLGGGCVSNAFIVKDGRLVTPIARGEEGGDGEGAALPSPVLPGITRAWVIEQAESRGIGVERRMVTIDDVLGADELFLTNSSWGVLPVVRLEKGTIAGGTVGEVTRLLRDARRESLEAAAATRC